LIVLLIDSQFALKWKGQTEISKDKKQKNKKKLVRVQAVKNSRLPGRKANYSSW
jgi:hypothetical protein